MFTRIGIFVALAAALPALAGGPDAEVEYLVSIGVDSPRLARVKAHAAPGERGYCFLRAAADTALTHGWATFVRNLEVEDSAGNVLPARYDGAGCWEVDSERASVVTYDMLLQHDRFPNDPGDDELAYAADDVQFWTGRALFVEGAPARSVGVSFDVPADWQITVPWERGTESGWHYRLSSWDRLFDTALMAGKQWTRTIEASGVSLALGLVGDGPVSRAGEIEALLRIALKDFSEDHRAEPGGHLGVFVGQGRLLGGGVVGNAISMLVMGEIPDQAMPMLAHIITHETFHLWNSRISYEDDQGFYWFSEGFAEYFSYLQALRNGRLGSDMLVSMLDGRYRRYTGSAGAVSLWKAGAAKQENYDLIYDGGLFLALAMDQRIYLRSNGQARLGDILASVYAGHGPGQEDLTLNGLASLIANQTGVDVGDLIERHVKGVEAVPFNATDNAAEVAALFAAGRR